VRRTGSTAPELSPGIFDAESGQYFGGTSLRKPDWDLRLFEIGYWLRTTATGHGFVTDAIHLPRDFAIQALQVQQVHSSCDARDDTSRHVAERCGFVLEGVLRNALATPSGELADCLILALVPENWERLRLD
jgi:RimJ/RimL family protein N-acetyltransferase